MSIHTFLDRATVAMGGLYGDTLKFFRDGVDSPHVGVLVRDLDVEQASSADSLEKFGGTKHGGDCPVTLLYQGAKLPTSYRVLQWAGPTAPAVIFHHGSGDYPYHKRAAAIFGGARAPENVTLIATNIPFNSHGKMEYIRAVGRLENFALMLAGAAVLIEDLVSRLRAAGCAHVTVSGISLGGWITNLHKAYFDTATEYRPIFAGAAPDHLFRETVYAKMAAKPAQEHPEAITAAIRFEDDFASRDNGNVHALMARYDQYIILDRQARIYRPDHVTVIDTGHVTGTLKNDALSSHATGAAQTVARPG